VAAWGHSATGPAEARRLSRPVHGRSQTAALAPACRGQPRQASRTRPRWRVRGAGPGLARPVLSTWISS